MSTPTRTIILAAGPLQVRGTSSYTLRLAEQLSDFGFSPIIVTPDITALPEEVHPHCPIHEYSLLEAPFIRPLITRLAARDVADTQPCLVHIQSRHALTFGCALSKRLNLPCLLTLHDYDRSRSRIAVEAARLKRVIAVSRSVKDALVTDQSMDEELITVIHSGVRVPDVLDNADVLTGRRIPVIGAAGPLEVSKGFAFFIQAARQVLDAGHDAEFVIAGAGPEERRLRALTRQLNLSDHVTFIPNLPDFSAAIRAMDIFCLPSLMQGLGTVMLEAMALGRPVIATGVGGVSSIVKDGETGLVIPASNSARLAERIIELLADPIRARAIGSAARQRVLEAFDATRMVELTAAEYVKAISD